jgi:hypothetical protein
MKSRITVAFFSFVFLLATSAAFGKPKRTGHAHTHGEAIVDIAVDEMTAAVGINIDAQSLVGFEHTAKTAKEKEKVASVLKLFRSNIANLISFDSKLNCQFAEKSLSIGPVGSTDRKRTKREREHKHEHEADRTDGHDHDHDHGSAEHHSLKGDFDVVCKQKITPSKLQINLKSTFAAIQKIKVNVVNGNQADTIEMPGNGVVNLRQ